MLEEVHPVSIFESINLGTDFRLMFGSTKLGTTTDAKAPDVVPKERVEDMEIFHGLQVRNEAHLDRTQVVVKALKSSVTV